MTSYQVAEWLRKGIAAAQAGDVERAYELLLKVVDIDEYNEQAWLWLSSVVESDVDREVCLENVLAVNPDNTLAKAGLVHLRNKSVLPPAPPVESEARPPSQPELEPSSSITEASIEALATDWWDQAQPSVSPSTPEAFWADAPSTLSAPTAEQVQIETGWAQPRSKMTLRRVPISMRRLVIVALLLLGLLAASAAIMAVLQVGVFNPTKLDYARAMRPLLAEYDAWWAGPQGNLVEELDDFCGPGADGWRNQDVLRVCSLNPALDCALLVAHCGADVEAMRKQVTELSRAAQESGTALVSDFAAVSPPDEIALAHTRFVACVRARVADAVRVGGLARGESLVRRDDSPTCQMFAFAEAEVRAYVGDR
jgi:hypothetical protein